MIVIVTGLLLTAESAYRDGVTAADDASRARPHFRESARLYEQCWREDGLDSPALHRNRAQAYLLADDLPNALRAYHEGRRAWPADVGLREGQQYARSQVVYRTDGKLRERATPRPSGRLIERIPSERILVGLWMLYLTFWSGLVMASITRRRFWWVLSGVSGPIALLGWVILQHEQHELDREPTWAVVAKDRVTLREGNGTSFAPQIDESLPMGIEVRVRHRRGGWVQVELTDGTPGWLPESGLVEEVQQVTPSK